MLYAYNGGYCLIFTIFDGKGIVYYLVCVYNGYEVVNNGRDFLVLYRYLRC